MHKSGIGYCCFYHVTITLQRLNEIWRKIVCLSFVFYITRHHQIESDYLILRISLYSVNKSNQLNYKWMNFERKRLFFLLKAWTDKNKIRLEQQAIGSVTTHRIYNKNKNWHARNGFSLIPTIGTYITVIVCYRLPVPYTLYAYASSII